MIGKIRCRRIVLTVAIAIGVLGLTHFVPTPPAIAQRSITPSQNDIDELTGDNVSLRNTAFGNLVKLDYGRKAIVDTVGAQTKPELVKFYHDLTDWDLVPSAIDALSSGGSPNWYAVVVLGNQFSDGSQYDSAQQAKIRQIVLKLTTLCTTASDPVDAATALARLGKYATPQIRDRLTSGRPVERAALANALAATKHPLGPEFNSAVTKLATDPDPKIRATAMQMIRSMTDPMKLYDAIYRTPDTAIRLNVIDGYAAMIDKTEAKAALESAAKDTNPAIHIAAQTALNAPKITLARGPEALHAFDMPYPPRSMLLPLETLVPALTSPSTTTPAKARIAIEIGEYGEDALDASPTLGKVAANQSFEMPLRLAAVEALGRIGPRAFRQLPAIAPLVQRRDERIRQVAGLARDRIRKDDFRIRTDKVSINAIPWPYNDKKPATVEDHLHFLTQLVALYRRDHNNAFPDSQADLDTYAIDPEQESVFFNPLDPPPIEIQMALTRPHGAAKAFINPRDPSNPGFYYIKPADTNGAATPMIFEGMGNPLVAMTDGSIRKLDAHAFPPILRRTEANLYDLRNAVSRFKSKHGQRFPDHLDQLREYFADDEAWKQTITNPQTGESPGYGFAAPPAKMFNIDELATQAMIFTIYKGVKAETAPAIYADEHLRY